MPEKIRWGILSTGHISGRFAEALKILPEAEIIAVASRNAGTAKKFAEEHGILKAYGSYSALTDDPEVDVVYIGTPHSFHLENSVMCMKAGKSVLCEKALTINAREAEEMIRVAGPESKIVIADEVERLARLVDRSSDPSSSAHDGGLDKAAPVHLVPDRMEEIRVDGIWKLHGKYHGYCLEFRKPA